VVLTALLYFTSTLKKSSPTRKRLYVWLSPGLKKSNGKMVMAEILSGG